MYHTCTYCFYALFYDIMLLEYYYRPRSEGDKALGSVRPSVRPFVCALTAKSIRSHYQSKVFVCVSSIRGAYTDKSADAVVLIF